MRKKLILINAGVVIVGLIAAFLLAMPQVQNLYKEEFARRLDTALAFMLSDTDRIAEDPQGFVEQEREILQQAGQDMRITIISTDGQVLGDSDLEHLEEPDPVTKNHLTRPEIYEAKHYGKGYDTRDSASLHESYYYAAVYVEGQFYLRAALPLTEMNRAMTSMQLCLLGGILLGCAVAVVLAFFSARSITRPLVKLTEATRHISEGDFDSRVEVNGDNEIGNLAKAFNRMADTTSGAFHELHRKHRQLEGVLQGMDDGVLAVNGHGNVLVINDRARELLEAQNLREEDPLNGNLALARLREFLEQARAQQASVRGEMRTGSPEHIMTVYAAPLNKNRSSEGALAVVADVTEMRRLQQLRSEFVANVTHELKTPLTSIRGFIELLKSGDRDEETRQYFYEVLDIEAERLHNLIDDMLVLSQIENAKEDTSAVSCDLEKELKNTVSRMLPLAKKQDVSLDLEVKDPGLCVLSSSSRLQQLFGNLVDNAIKYNKPGGSVTITLQRQRQTAVMRIKDTGIGIPAEHLDRLFERFYRVDTSRSREIGGTGLGLSIVKHLAGLYNGDVSVESTPGEGSTFTVRLPLAGEEPKDSR